MIRKLALGAGALALVAAGILFSRPFDRSSDSAPPPSVATPSSPVGGSSAEVAPEAGRAAGSAAERAERLKTLETRAIEALPTIAEIRKKTNEEVHTTPEEILDSGRRFGELADYLAKNPDLVRAALPTYVRCAEDANVVTATRALCAFRLHVYERDWDDATRASYAKLPSDVRQVAKRLEGTE